MLGGGVINSNFLKQLWNALQPVKPYYYLVPYAFFFSFFLGGGGGGEGMGNGVTPPFSLCPPPPHN